MIDASAFNFDAMKEAVGVDPFAQQNSKYARDERFYTLTKDKETGIGAAIIRFLPDSEKGMIQKLFKINTTIIKNGKKRFVNEFSPSSIGHPCPFQEHWQELWNAGDKDEAKKFSRGTRFITNIKVLKDPANPENEGKIFLYEMSGAMKDKIQSAVDPSEQDRALGAEPKQLFNPLQGNSFKLACKKGSNNQINYDNSEVVTDVTSIYGSVEEALEDIQKNTHKLSDLLKPESFLSYEEFQKKMDWVMWKDQETVTPAAPLAAEPAVAQVAQPEVQPAAQSAVVQEAPVEVAQTPANQPAQASTSNQSLDSLLDGLV